mgnify:CR=1 FL=1
MIPTAILTNWNEFYFNAFNIIFGLGIFLIITLQIISTSKFINNTHILRSVPLISIIVFSLKQFANWLWGLQLVVFMSVFFTVLGIIILSRPLIRAASFWGALCCGIVGSFSFLNGLLIWPIGFLILLLGKAKNNLKKPYLFTWIIVGATTVLLFLYDYQKPPSHHPSIFFVFKHPFFFLAFVFSFLGGPLAAAKEFAPFIGIAGIMLLMFFTLLLLKSDKKNFHILLPYLSLSLYSILTAIIIAIGRAGWGWQEGLSPRYVTHSIFFWVAVTVILFIGYGSFISEQKFKHIKISSKYFIIALTLLTTTTSLNSIPYFFDSYVRWTNARTDLLIMKNMNNLLPLEQFSEVYRRSFFLIRDRHLSAFRNNKS